MPFLVNDRYNDHVEECTSLEEVFSYFSSEEVGSRYVKDYPDVYAISEKIDIVVNPQTFSVKGRDSDIPAPLPGESVSDYARRLTGA